MSDKISIADARKAESVGREVIIEGWVRTRRDSKAGFSFLELNDGSCFGNVQVIAEAVAAELRVGDQKAFGRIQPARGRRSKSLARQGTGDRSSRPERHRLRHGRRRSVSAAKERAIRSSSSAPSPICGRARTPSAPSPGCGTACATRSTSSSRKRASSTSTRRSSRPAIAKGRARCSRSPRSICRNCAQARGRKLDFALDFFDRPAYLTVSGQLEAEIFACSLGKAYTFGPTFRAENSNTPRHLAEFWMVEPEMAFCDLWGDMELAEGLSKANLPRRAGKMPGGHGRSSTSGSTRR